MKILFLDIDGVLNSRTSTLVEDYKGLPDKEYYNDNFENALLHFHADRLDTQAIMCLNFILDSVDDLKIIVHSTWSRMFGIKEIQAALEKMGLKKDSIIGTTQKKFSSNKCHEVSWTLQDFNDDFEADLDAYVIIENTDIDVDNGDGTKWFGKNLYLVDDDIGLCFKDVGKIIAHFDPEFEMPEFYM